MPRRDAFASEYAHPPYVCSAPARTVRIGNSRTMLRSSSLVRLVDHPPGETPRGRKIYALIVRTPIRRDVASTLISKCSACTMSVTPRGR